MASALQPRLGPLTTQRGSLESSPLLPPGKGGVGTRVVDDVPEREERHRCARASRIKPYVLASVAVGAGSFAQGCARRALHRAASAGAACTVGSRSPACTRRVHSYDGTAIGFLLTTHFGGYVPVR